MLAILKSYVLSHNLKELVWRIAAVKLWCGVSVAAIELEQAEKGCGWKKAARRGLKAGPELGFSRFLSKLSWDAYQKTLRSGLNENATARVWRIHVESNLDS